MHFKGKPDVVGRERKFFSAYFISCKKEVTQRLMRKFPFVRIVVNYSRICTGFEFAESLPDTTDISRYHHKRLEMKSDKGFLRRI